MKKETKQKILVILVAAIFLGSYAGMALQKEVPQEGQAEIPKEQILQNITEQQSQLIVSKGFAILYCAQCPSEIENLTLVYTPYVFLVKGENATFSLKGQSYKGTEELSYNITAVEDWICDNVPYRIDRCILRKI